MLGMNTPPTGSRCAVAPAPAAAPGELYYLFLLMSGHVTFNLGHATSRFNFHRGATQRSDLSLCLDNANLFSGLHCQNIAADRCAGEREAPQVAARMRWEKDIGAHRPASISGTNAFEGALALSSP